MPRGIFLLVHNEIKGPEIKCFYYKIPLDISQEFVSKLYMSHAGFEASSLMELKYNHYRIVSCFTGHKARKTRKEGILGLILEENEIIDNLELFLRRNLIYGLLHPTNQAMEELLRTRLLNFIKLNRIFKKVEIENIPEILIINGDTEYKSSLVRIGEKQVSNMEIGGLYKKIIKNQEIPQFKYYKLDAAIPNTTFLLVKYEKPSPHIDKIFSIMKPYLEHFFNYSLEIFALFLLAPIITPICLNSEVNKDQFDTNKSLLQILQKSNDYYYDFNNLIPLILNNEIYLTSISRFNY
ncbi:MAG TPA: hypothetical protein VMV49_03930 [Candidatus Deferrimicrobium sp.]|nr:hypothetical protein [Candidatus Deferrimicrobium sp.]